MVYRCHKQINIHDNCIENNIHRTVLFLKEVQTVIPQNLGHEERLQIDPKNQ